MFIVLEGLDGAGKSTQREMLEMHFAAKGKIPKQLHFPRFDAPIYGELIAKFLRGDFGEVNSVDPQVIGLLYAGDRNDAAPMIREWLADGNIVIVDRYVYSNIAYQCSKTKTSEEKQQLREWVLNLEYEHYNIPRPTVNIFLDVPLSHIENRLTNRCNDDDRSYLNGQKDIHEASFELQRKVRELYLEQRMLDSTFRVVSCANECGCLLSPDEVFEKILTIVKEFQPVS